MNGTPDTIASKSVMIQDKSEEEDKMVIKGENRQRKIEKRKRAMRMSGKGTIRLQNELAFRAEQRKKGDRE